jgi:hypothetical protein
MSYPRVYLKQSLDYNCGTDSSTKQGLLLWMTVTNIKPAFAFASVISRGSGTTLDDR